MLSEILLDDKPHPAPFTDLDDVIRLEGVISGCELSVDPDSALFDEPPGLAVRPGEATHHHSLDQPQGEPRLVDAVLRHLLGHLPATERAVEVLGRPQVRLLLDQPLY